MSLQKDQTEQAFEAATRTLMIDIQMLARLYAEVKRTETVRVARHNTYMAATAAYHEAEERIEAQVSAVFHALDRADDIVVLDSASAATEVYRMAREAERFTAGSHAVTREPVL